MLILITLCALGWVQFFWRNLQGQPAVPYESRNSVPWGLLDFLMIFLAALVIQAAMSPMLPKPHYAIRVGIEAGAAVGGAPGAQVDFDELGLDRIGVVSVVSLAVWAVSLVLLHWRSGATARDIGLPVVSGDIRLGFVAFCLLSIPVFLIQFLLSQKFPETKHPLIDALLANPNNTFFAVAGFAAVIVAPIVEEFLFRVYLQGWLENLAVLRQDRLSNRLHPPDFPSRVFWGTVARYQEDVNLVSSELETTDDMPGVPSLDMRPAWWPIVVSSSLFAVAHYGHGPAPIPLFFLALGLGYLYQRTHRVWPGITVHCLVNLTSLCLLWVHVQTQQV